MKKIIINALTHFVLFTSVSTSFALSSDCPPSAKMKNQPLTQAISLGFNHRWSLASPTFIENHRHWNLFFIVELPNATSSAQALKEGREAFDKAAITNNHPYPYQDNGMTYCDYAKESHYAITAATAVDDGIAK